MAGCRPSAERNGTEPRLPSPGWVGLCTLFSRDDGTPSPRPRRSAPGGPPSARGLAGRHRAGQNRRGPPRAGGSAFLPPWGADDKTERNPFPMKMKTIPWKSAFLRVALGQAVSQLGSHGVQFALIWWLAEETASPGVLGAAGLVAYLPMTLLSPPGGVAADRWNRKVLCITADLAMGGGGPGVCRPAGPVCPAPLDRADPAGPAGVGRPSSDRPSSPSSPAGAGGPVGPGQRLDAAAQRRGLPPGAGDRGGPVRGLPLPVVLLSDVVGAALASLALAGVKIPPLVRQADQTGGFWAEFQAGLAVFRRDRALGRLVAAQALCMFFYAPLSAFYPLMTSDYFSARPGTAARVELAFAVGMVVSAFAFSKVGQVGGSSGCPAWVCSPWGGGRPCAGCPHPRGLGGLCRAVPGAGGRRTTCTSSPLQAYLQETVPAEQMGRAFSVLTLISSAAMPVGLLVSAPWPSRWGWPSGSCCPALPCWRGPPPSWPSAAPPRPRRRRASREPLSSPNRAPAEKSAPASHGDAGALLEEEAAGVTWRIPRP